MDEHTNKTIDKQNNHNRAFLIGIVLNMVYIAIEFGYGLINNSMALIADSGHNLSDVLGLALAWIASYLATKQSTSRRTYGYRKSTILASLFNAIILLIAVGAILYESIHRISVPVEVHGSILMIVAGIGVVINTITALLFIKGSKDDLNIKGAFLHMAADAAVSVGVVLGGIIIYLTDYNLIDPLISIVIAIIITYGTCGLLKESFNLSIDSVPNSINVSEVKEYILSLESVKDIHDIHIWSISTTEIAFTAHIIRNTQDNNDEFISKLSKKMKDKFNIGHSTIQIELNNLNDQCS